jgi:hypothetical protein
VQHFGVPLRHLRNVRLPPGVGQIPDYVRKDGHEFATLVFGDEVVRPRLGLSFGLDGGQGPATMETSDSSACLFSSCQDNASRLNIARRRANSPSLIRPIDVELNRA